MGLIEDCRQLSDQELERALSFMAERDKHSLPNLLAHLAEYDARQLCVKKWHSDLFSYCVHNLKFEEGDAYRRIRAARVVRKWPEVIAPLEGGLLHLSALVSLSPVLTNENRKEWFKKAEGKTRREIEAMIAEVHPEAARPDWTRRMPAPGGWTLGAATPPRAIDVLPAAGAQSSQPGPGEAMGPEPESSAPTASGERPWEWQAMAPIGMDRVRIGFDAAIILLRLIDRARQVLRHKYPAGRLEDVVREALETLLDKKDPQRALILKGPASVAADAPAGEAHIREIKAGRYIPAKVKQAVWQRDEGRCSWRDADGVVCGSRDWIEFDHIVPFGKGGRSETRNVRLLCRLHNRVAAFQEYGRLPSKEAGSAPLSAAGG